MSCHWKHKLLRDLQFPWWAKRYRAVCENSITSSVCFCFFCQHETWSRPEETSSFYWRELHFLCGWEQWDWSFSLRDIISLCPDSTTFSLWLQTTLCALLLCQCTNTSLKQQWSNEPTKWRGFSFSFSNSPLGKNPKCCQLHIFYSMKDKIKNKCLSVVTIFKIILLKIP